MPVAFSAMTVPESSVEPSPDLVFGAFSDHGPWVLDPDALPWQWDIDRIRRGTRREVPRLLAPGRLPPLGRLSRTLVEIGGALGGLAASSSGAGRRRAPASPGACAWRSSGSARAT